MDACENLSKASDTEVVEKITSLLEWMQDLNWPVAPHICERLKSIGSPLVSPVKTILLGNDDVWKYWVISSLLSKISRETLMSLKSDLENIVDNPTESEKTEEVNIVAKEVLNQCR